MPWTEDLPEWNEAGVEPPAAKKNTGWEPEEKPPAGWFNWLFNRIYDCIVELRDNVATNPLNADLDCDGNTITGAQIEDYVETAVISSGTGAQTLDLEDGNVFEHTVDANTETTISLDSVRSGAQSFTLHLIQHGDEPTVTLNFTIHWPGDTIPNFALEGLNIITCHRLRTTDPWIGHLVGQDYGEGAS